MGDREVLSIGSAYGGWLAVSAALRELPVVRRLGEAVTEREAIALAREMRPDVILVADEVEGRPAFPLLGALREAAADARIVVLAQRVCPAEQRRLLSKLGITDYLLWDDLRSYERLRAVLEVIIVHGFVVNSPAPVAAYLADRRRGSPESAGGAREIAGLLAAFARRYGLTRREQEVLALLGQGRSNDEIARALGVGESTAASHVSRILRKLDVTSRTVRFASCSGS